jgi:putative tricarboxylic transport membrane protein
MDFVQTLLLGFSVVLTPANLFYCFIGCLIGTLVGVLPGIGPMAAISLLLPITFQIPATASVIMLSGIFYGAMYGGSITSILVNIPGEAASVATCLDGHQMARQGRAGAALGIAALGSFIAGSVSTVGLNFFSPALVAIALRFGPPEYFAMMTLGFVVCVFMVGGSLLKALLMIAAGLFASTVGMDVIDGQERFTFGAAALGGGFDMVAVIMGMFGVSEVILNMEETLRRQIFARVERVLPTQQDWRASAKPMARGSVLGFVVGILPGAGPVTAAFLSYAVERRLARDPGRFGKGAIEGVAGPEAANNAAVAGSMVPLLSLGLPCNGVTALMMGALIIHGVQPGPTLMAQHPDIFWGVIASLYVGNFMLLVLNLPLIGLWVRFLRIPYWALAPAILLLCFIGTYSVNLNMFDVWVMIGFGVLGYVLRKLHYELAPFILALILGPLFEQSLRQALIMSHQNILVLLSRPITAGLLAVSAVLLAVFFVSVWKKGRQAQLIEMQE